MGYIYKISNNINDKLYIGKTCTTILNRWSHHKNDYLKYDWHLYRAMRKYGIENFRISIVEECNDELLNEREVYWISYYDTLHNGYNETIGGEGRQQLNRDIIKEEWLKGKSAQEIANFIGEKTHSSTIINILKELNLYDLDEVKKRKMLDIAKKQSIGQIIQYDEKGNEICRYDSVLAAANAVNGKTNSIQSAIYSGGSRYGYFWSREQKEVPKFKEIKQPKIRPILQFDKNNNFIDKYNSAAEAARENNATDGSSILKVCKGKRKTAYGYIWRYENDFN